jgi:quercetin dioxygenase-like cupin family protein
MRRSHSAIFVGYLAIGLAIVASGQPKTEVGGFTELHREDVAEAPGLEIVMGLIKRAGRSTGARHYHPGGEFGFVLEGAVIITTESEPSVTLEAGASFYQPPGKWHVVNTAIGGAQTVVFRLLEKGQPMIVAVD